MEEITPENSVVPIYLVPLTEEQEAERARLDAEVIERESAQKANLDAKDSALIKLAKLGLTEEEAKAIIGI